MGQALRPGGSRTPGNRGVRPRHFWHDEQAEAYNRTQDEVTLDEIERIRI